MICLYMFWVSVSIAVVLDRSSELRFPLGDSWYSWYLDGFLQFPNGQDMGRASIFLQGEWHRVAVTQWTMWTVQSMRSMLKYV